jgi:sugar lactone lactonase YvrE
MRLWLNLLLGVLCAATTACGSDPNGNGKASGLAVLAGVPSGEGSEDGPGGAARFFKPGGVAVDSEGNLFIADTNNFIIRKITPTGVVTTIAGSPGTNGSMDGNGTAASFAYPAGIAVDGSGNIFVADSGNFVIRKIAPGGEVTTFAGTAGEVGSEDGTGAGARFMCPGGLALDRAGNLFVADYSIRKITPAGVVTTVTNDVPPENAANADLAVDGEGNLFVVSEAGEVVTEVTPAGKVSTFAGTEYRSGSADGTGADARFSSPKGVAVDGAGNVFVTDKNAIRKITPAREVSTFAGAADSPGSSDGIGGAARFFAPSGMAADGAGNLWVADTGNNTIRKVTSAGVVTTIAGTSRSIGSNDGAGPNARFFDPSDLVVDKSGNVFVVDASNDVVRKVTPTGTVTTFAGTAGVSGASDGLGSAARLSHPDAVALDRDGNLVVLDLGSGKIRKITPAGEVTTRDVFFYTSNFGFGGVAVDGAGNVFIADNVNSVIWKMGPAGQPVWFAGGGSSKRGSDGTGKEASFDRPQGIAVDGADNLYVADSMDCTIRKITPAAVVTTLAGSTYERGSADGTGPAARFFYPIDVALDGEGNVYVADFFNNAIRKITRGGVVTTVVGVASAGVTGNRPGQLPASIVSPTGVAVDASRGRLYITVTDALMVANINW